VRLGSGTASSIACVNSVSGSTTKTGGTLLPPVTKETPNPSTMRGASTRFSVTGRLKS